MDAIKKKMQAMKLEKDNAMDRADTCEQQARDANLRAEKVRFWWLNFKNEKLPLNSIRFLDDCILTLIIGWII